VKTILIVSPVATHPPHRGNRQRIIQMAELFRHHGYQIHLAIGRNRPITRDAREFWDEIHPLNKIPRWRPTKRNVPLDRWYTPGLGEELSTITQSIGAEMVLLNYIFHSKALDFLPSHVLKIIDTHDVFSGRSALYSRRHFTRGFFSCSAANEKDYLSRADEVIAISNEDASVFTSVGLDREKLTVIPFAKDVPTVSPKRLAQSSPPVFGLVMSANDLNLSALSELVTAVDATYGNNPPFRVMVAGDINKLAYRWAPHRAFLFKKPWIEYLGEVPDIASVYSSVNAMLAPVSAGSGMAIKFSDPVISGVPVIATSVGSRGCNVNHPLHDLSSIPELVGRIGSITPQEIAELTRASQGIKSTLHATASSTFQSLIKEIEATECEQ